MRFYPGVLGALISTAAIGIAPEAIAQTPPLLFSGLTGTGKDAIQVEADALEVTEAADGRVSAFRGNVTVVRGNTVLKAATITIFSPAGEAASGKDPFDRIEASGKVYVRSADQVATGDAARFDVKTQTAVLSGNVVLTQGTNVITGDRLTIDLKSGKARVEQRAGGRIRGIFTPNAVVPARQGN